MKNSLITLVIIVVAAVITLVSVFFRVPEGRQALITQFGEIKGDPITEAGLHMKVPFIQDVRMFDKRILSWDGDKEQIPTKDKKYIWVDTTARWKISEVRKFAETVQNEAGGKERLDGILDGVTRDTISDHNLVEAVRNSNAIIERIEEAPDAKGELEKNEEKDPEELLEGDTPEDPEKVVKQVIQQEITGDIEPIDKGREELSNIIIKRARENLAPFGISLIDVQLRRIAYQESVQDKVYDRMISERERIAEKVRSIGRGEKAKIEGRLQKDLKKIESEAFRQSKEIRGAADAEATRIYASELSKDPEHYEFLRTLEVYENTLPERGRLILSTGSELLKRLESRQ